MPSAIRANMENEMAPKVGMILVSSWGYDHGIPERETALGYGH